MVYKFGLKLWSINTDHYLKEAQKLYDEGIYDYIELYVVPNTLGTIPQWKELKIPFIIHNSHFAQGFNLAKQEKAEHNREIYEETKQFADELNAEYIIFHGGIDGDIRETAIQLALFNEPRALIENKPFVALPNRMGGEFCRGYNTDEIKTVIDTANCEFCLDFGHAICAANSLGENVYDYLQKFIKLKPKMFHLTDVKDIASPYDSHPHIGDGELDVSRILKLIPNEAKITVETIKNSKTDLNDFIKDVETLKRIATSVSSC